MPHGAALRIRLATPADAGAVAQLSRHAIEQGLAWSWTPRRVVQNVRDADTNVIVARDRAGLAGFAIMGYGEEEAHLLLLAVSPGRRRRGVGSALLRWLEATARVAGLRAIRLELRTGNAAARAFYRRHGFEDGGIVEGYYQGLEDALRMAKELSGERRAAPKFP